MPSTLEARSLSRLPSLCQHPALEIFTFTEHASKVDHPELAATRFAQFAPTQKLKLNLVHLKQ